MCSDVVGNAAVAEDVRGVLLRKRSAADPQRETEFRSDRDVALRHLEGVVRDFDRVVLCIDDRQRVKLVSVCGRDRQRDGFARLCLRLGRRDRAVSDVPVDVDRIQDDDRHRQHDVAGSAVHERFAVLIKPHARIVQRAGIDTLWSAGEHGGIDINRNLARLSLMSIIASVAVAFAQMHIRIYLKGNRFVSAFQCARVILDVGAECLIILIECADLSERQRVGSD